MKVEFVRDKKTGNSGIMFPDREKKNEKGETFFMFVSPSPAECVYRKIEDLECSGETTCLHNGVNKFIEKYLDSLKNLSSVASRAIFELAGGYERDDK